MGSWEDALADKGLGEEMVRTLRSGAKDTSAATTKDRRHLAKGSAIDNKDVVHMREQREQQDAVKHKKPKTAK